VGWILSVVLSGRASGQVDGNAFNADLNALASVQSRSPGTDGYFKAAAYLEQQLAGLPGVEWRRHEFPLTVPLTDFATITATGLPGGDTQNIYPVWPAGIRVCGTPEAGVTGKLV